MILIFAKNRKSVINLVFYNFFIILISSCAWINTSAFKNPTEIAESLGNDYYPADLNSANIKKLEDSADLITEVMKLLFKKLENQANNPQNKIINANLNTLEELLISKENSQEFDKKNLNLKYLLDNPIYSAYSKNISIYKILSEDSTLRYKLINELRDYINENQPAAKDSYAFENLDYLLSDAFDSIQNNELNQNLTMMTHTAGLEVGAYAEITGHVAYVRVVIKNSAARSLLLKIEDVLIVDKINITLNHMQADKVRFLNISPKDTLTTEYAIELSKAPKASEVFISLKIDDKAYFLKNNSAKN